METKRIVILANSIKRNARCVAGIDLSARRGHARAAWIRPVSGESQGELEPWHMMVAGGSPLELLDVMDVPLLRYADDSIHPEDWIVDTTSNWKPAGRIHPIALDGLEEHPEDLWLEFEDRPDRATASFLLQRPNHQSLYLIRPRDFHVELTCERNSHKSEEQKRKTRARFIYGGQEYHMSLTDPVFTDKHCVRFPAVGAKASVVRPPYGDHCLLCVSLTPEFYGYHYKVVAAVLELP
jgi:hypothetical protein